MPFLFPNDPVQVSLAFLARINAEEPGKYLGSCKWDGWRRLVVKENGKWVWRAKPSGAGALTPIADSVRVEFEELDLPSEMVYDCEYVGFRMIENSPEPCLYVFDWYPLSGPCPSFEERHIGLGNLIHGENVRFVDQTQNPHLMDLFERQLCNPLSEGIVVKRADSRVEGHPSRCTDHSHCYKIKYRNVREKIRRVV